MTDAPYKPLYVAIVVLLCPIALVAVFNLIDRFNNLPTCDDPGVLDVVYGQYYGSFYVPENTVREAFDDGYFEIDFTYVTAFDKASGIKSCSAVVDGYGSVTDYYYRFKANDEIRAEMAAFGLNIDVQRELLDEDFIRRYELHYTMNKQQLDSPEWVVRGRWERVDE